jgi:glycerophosphoryl diester phosphodiesterase
MPIPELVGHRGYPRHYPENSLIGIEAAIAAGARFIETDVQLTQDQVPVLFHDHDLTRICGVQGTIADFTFEQLQQFPAGEFTRFGYKFVQTRIPALWELGALLARHPKVTAFIELKRTAIERFGAETVLEHMHRALKPVIAKTVPISYALDALPAARPRWPAVGAVIDQWRDRKQDLIRNLKPEYLFCDVAGLPRFGKLRHPGAQIVVFEIAEARAALRLAVRGADLIETFAVGELRQELELIGVSA